MVEDWRDIVARVAGKLRPQDAAAVREWETEQERLRLASALRTMDLPDRILADLDSPDLDPDRHPIPAIKDALVEGQRMVLLAGTAGTGKTVAAAWIVHRLPGAYFLRLTRYLALESSHKTAWEAERASLRSALVIDEIGEEEDWQRGKVDQLLAVRYDMASSATTICTSNLTISAFRERYGERIASRFRDPRYCAIIMCRAQVRPQRKGKR